MNSHMTSVGISLESNCNNISGNLSHMKRKLSSSSLLFPVHPHNVKSSSVCALALLLAGDIQMNPGPGNGSIFPCGLCGHPVICADQGVCCNECSVWHHKPCEDKGSREMEILNKSSVIWYCCKCDSLNVDSFTYNRVELYTSNAFIPLSDLDITLASVNSSVSFNQLFTSSPSISNGKPSRSKLGSVETETSQSFGTDTKDSKSINLPKDSNLRLLTANCCSVKELKSKFKAAADYVKPYIICGTESWLNGIKPGKEPNKKCIKNCEVFPDNFNFYRNDRIK